MLLVDVDTAYGAVENIAALEQEHIRAYVPLPDKEIFASIAVQKSSTALINSSTSDLFVMISLPPVSFPPRCMKSWRLRIKFVKLDISPVSILRTSLNSPLPRPRL